MFFIFSLNENFQVNELILMINYFIKEISLFRVVLFV